MLQSLYPMPPQNQAPYSQQLPLHHNDFFMTQPLASRPLRASASQYQPSASTALRVVKPASANSSPRFGITAARRRSIKPDASNPLRQQQVLNYLNTAHPMLSPPAETPARRDYPYSPQTLTLLYTSHSNLDQQQHQQHQQHQQQQQHQHTPATTDPHNLHAEYPDFNFGNGPQYSPAADSYSTNTSPASTCSPLPTAFAPLESDEYFGPDVYSRHLMLESLLSNGNGSNRTTTTTTTTSNNNNSMAPSHQVQVQNGADWNSFIMHGFNTTSPPTPETFLQPPQPQQQQKQQQYPHYHHLQALAAQEHQMTEAATFAAMTGSAESGQGDEDEGEILVGMGLYDTPGKFGEDQDPQLNNYRSTVTSLLGSTFGGGGKGLKLEETWEPPKSDDEEEEEEEGDGSDAEGEEES